MYKTILPSSPAVKHHFTSEQVVARLNNSFWHLLVSLSSKTNFHLLPYRAYRYKVNLPTNSIVPLWQMIKEELVGLDVTAANKFIQYMEVTWIGTPCEKAPQLWNCHERTKKGHLEQTIFRGRQQCTEDRDWGWPSNSVKINILR